jgi:hypothetical protein
VRALPNFDVRGISCYSEALRLIEEQLVLLQEIVGECDPLTDADREQLVKNIEWLKAYYEAAERCLLERTA